MKLTKKQAKNFYTPSVFLVVLLGVGCVQIEAYEVLPILLIVLIISTMSIIHLDKME